MDRPNKSYPGGGYQGPNPAPHHYGSMEGTGQVNNPDCTASTSPAQIIPIEVEDELGENIYKMSPHVPISHDDTFKESSAIQGFAFMKTVSRLIYEYTHFAIYATLTLIIAPIMSFVWAIFFAIAHICVIWFSQPAIKMLYISLRVCQLVYVPFVRFFLDPLYKSLSLVFSSIRGQFRLHSSDVTLNMKTIQV
eukprot:XP_003728705.1 PREDICTED: caveolin-2 [Strongylocentrotus purpuratus]